MRNLVKHYWSEYTIIMQDVKFETKKKKTKTTKEWETQSKCKSQMHKKNCALCGH